MRMKLAIRKALKVWEAALSLWVVIKLIMKRGQQLQKMPTEEQNVLLDIWESVTK